MTIIYHNPRCSKSRQTLAILEENGITPDIVLYLDNPLDQKTIKSILNKLKIGPRELMRKNEDAYKANQLNNPDLSDDELINAMVEHPKIIERPIVVNGKKAVLGRPPENVLSII